MLMRLIPSLLMICLVCFLADTVSFSATRQTQSQRDLVGVYRWDGGFSFQSLELNRNGRFAFCTGACLSGGEWRGTFDLRSGHVVLSPKKYQRQLGPAVKGESKLAVTRYVPIRWGRRLYLLSEQELIDFCNDINIGEEPHRTNGGTGLLRQGDERKHVTDLPKLPEQWRKYVLTRPRLGKIISTEKYGHAAWVSLGLRHGLRKGMILTTSDGGWRRFEIAKITTTKCLIESEPSYTFQIGAKVSTRFPVQPES
jgi:hypothetical protein